MNTDTHLKVAGRAYIVWGTICLMLSSFIALRDLYRMSQVGWKNLDAWMGSLPFLLFIIVFVVAALQLCLGLGLSKRKPWATRIAGFLVSGLTLLSFPIGTILGAYTLVILSEIDKQEAINTARRN